MTNIFQMFTKMKDLQFNFAEIQKKMEVTLVSGSSSDGKVYVTVNGLRQILNIEIDPSLMNIDSKLLLQARIMEASNNALVQITEILRKEVPMPM
ncbi:MAG: YbaB/EbfC family nucleoid-associated protein [Cytophagales bacterium]|nr:YbaB/EbfC family nucleoid-associated protein [Cytophagales bacterium]